MFCQEVGTAYGLPVDRVVGILACLSVQNRWDVNKRNCEALCRAWSEGIDPETITVATYTDQKYKAIAILTAPADADISKLIGTKYAPKTRAFYSNILDPEHSLRVTLDRWIFRGLGLEQFTHGGGNRMIALYRNVEFLVCQAATKTDLRPCELQAAIWICIQETAQAEEWEGSRPAAGLATEEEEPAPF